MCQKESDVEKAQFAPLYSWHSHFAPCRTGVEDFGVRCHQDRPRGEPQEADPGPAHVLD